MPKAKPGNALDVFPREVAERLDSYVYRLEDPRTDRTFYVGKGVRDRVFEHAQLALAGGEGLRYDLIRELHAAGLEPRVIIHRHGMSDAVALEVEAALIDAYAHHDLANEVRGHGSERGLSTPDRLRELYGAPEAVIPVPAIAIKIEQQWDETLSAEQLYERTRRYWVCNPEERRRPPKVALCVARGIVREVYEIERWEEYPDMQREERCDRGQVEAPPRVRGPGHA